MGIFNVRKNRPISARKRMSPPINRRASINRKAGYNGWANYPTWYMNLSMVEEEDYEYLKEEVPEIIKDEEYPEHRLAEWLKSKAEEYTLDNLNEYEMAYALSRYALNIVDWDAIGGHLYRLAKDEGWLEEADED